MNMQDVAANPSSTTARGCWCNLTPLFRAFKMSYQPWQLLHAMLAVLAIWLVGVSLDSVWPRDSSVPMVQSAAGPVDELDAYISHNFSRHKAAEFSIAASQSTTVAGPFAVLYRHLKSNVRDLTAAVLSLRVVGDGPAPTVLGSLLRFPAAVLWLFERHCIYGMLFGALAIAAMSFFGGAAYRVAAVNATRDELVEFPDALRFARSKFVQFALTPVLPIGGLLALGFILMLGGLLGAIPALNILMSIFWFIALLIGIAMAVVAIGTLASWPLWFPTIAVEGSDMFDAFSSAFSFVFERPWKAILYALVSIIYGVVCFLFVKYFAWLLLWLVHLAVGWGTIGAVTPINGTSQPKLEAMWRMPPAPALPSWSDFGYSNLSWEYGWASFIMACWTMLLVLMVAAFGVSFFISSSTLTYLVLRREVDGTDMEDVWIEEEQLDAFDTPAAPSVAPAAATTGVVTSLPVVGNGGGAAT